MATSPKAPTPQTFEELLEAAAHEPKRERVDLSQHFGQPEGSVVFCFREPSVAEVFAANEEAPMIVRLYQFPESLARTVTMMGRSVESITPPTTEVPRRAIANLAKTNMPAFLTLVGAWQKVFPDLTDLGGAAEEAKKGASQETEE